MIYYITYSNDLYAISRDFSIKMAIKFGKVDRAIAYKPEDIDVLFYEKNKRILDATTGNGYWLWKPYFIKKTLELVENEDIVLYCDAASFLFRDCRTFLKKMDGDIWVSNIALIEKQFTKPELFQAMNCDEEKYTETNQIQANFIALRKSSYSLKFVDEWLDIAETNDNLLQETVYLRYPPDFLFIGHKSDQSILSLLCKKWNISPHLDPSQFGRVPQKYLEKGRLFKIPENQGEYKPSIILHRMRVPERKYCLKMWVGTWLPLCIINFLYTQTKISKVK